MMGIRRRRRSFDDALAVVSPLAFADSVEAYLTGLPSEELRPLVLRSIKRMHPADCAQFALFLGHDPSRAHVDEVGGPALPRGELQNLVESCDDLLPNRFAAFLRENPRAVKSLGIDAIEDIFKGLESEDALPIADPSAKRRLPLGAAGLSVLALVVALVPLAAQYAHQRGMLAGLNDAAILPAAPPAVHANAVAVRRPPVQPRSPRKAKKPAPVHKVTRVPAAATIARHPSKRPAHVAVRHYHRVSPHYLASAWKFDPSQNPYTAGRVHARAHWSISPRYIARRAAPRPTAGPVAATKFEQRAQLAVRSYLHAVIAGDTPSALQHLGLPANADVSSISESPIVSRDTRAQVVAIKTQPDGQARVQVDLTGRRGEYFEVFEVAHDGAAVRIAQRYYIPVNRTAEELSAKLLAKNH